MDEIRQIYLPDPMGGELRPISLGKYSKYRILTSSYERDLTLRAIVPTPSRPSGATVKLKVIMCESCEGLRVHRFDRSKLAPKKCAKCRDKERENLESEEIFTRSTSRNEKYVAKVVNKVIECRELLDLAHILNKPKYRDITNQELAMVRYYATRIMVQK